MSVLRSLTMTSKKSKEPSSHPSVLDLSWGLFTAHLHTENSSWDIQLLRVDVLDKRCHPAPSLWLLFIIREQQKFWICEAHSLKHLRKSLMVISIKLGYGFLFFLSYRWTWVLVRFLFQPTQNERMVMLWLFYGYPIFVIYFLSMILSFSHSCISLYKFLESLKRLRS